MVDKGNKNQQDSQIKIVTNWQNTQEPNPALRRLMEMLLRERFDDGEKVRREPDRPDY